MGTCSAKRLFPPHPHPPSVFGSCQRSRNAGVELINPQGPASLGGASELPARLPPLPRPRGQIRGRKGETPWGIAEVGREGVLAPLLPRLLKPDGHSDTVHRRNGPMCQGWADPAVVAYSATDLLHALGEIA